MRIKVCSWFVTSLGIEKNKFLVLSCEHLKFVRSAHGFLDAGSSVGVFNYFWVGGAVFPDFLQMKPKETKGKQHPDLPQACQSKEIQGSAGKCGEVRGSARKCGERSPGKCGEVRGSAGTANSTNNNVE